MKKIIAYSILCYFFFTCTNPNSPSKKLIDQNIYDIVLQNGRVINPASQTNDLLNIAIQADTIAAISQEKMKGKLVVDATNLVISPGFIDLHSHTPTPLGQYYQLEDGVSR